MTYTLENGEDLNRENPESFFIPSREERETLKKDDLVKLIFRFDDEDSIPERMWVQIVSRDGNKYKGKLDNTPYTTQTVKEGDEVIFYPENIIQIYR